MTKTVKFYCTILASLLIITTFAIAETVQKKQEESLNIYPSFSSTLDSPLFEIEFTNSSTTTLDILELLKNESIILDGIEYTRQIVLFGGNSKLEPNTNWQHTFSVDEFILGSKKQKYSKNLKRWRWKSSLKSGKHTLIVKFGGKESNLIEFVWDDSEPFLYE